VYHLGLEHRISFGKWYKVSVNYYDQANQLKGMKNSEGFKWLKKDVDTQPNDAPRGISQTLALSDETLYSLDDLELPKLCVELRSRIKVLQKRFRLKKKFSKDWHKMQNAIRKQHIKIARIRRDFLHKISTTLAKNHGLVTLEDLKIRNMSKSAKATAESPGRKVRAKSGLNREILF